MLRNIYNPPDINRMRSHTVTYLSSPLDTLPDTEVAENPCDAQGDYKLQSQAIGLVNLNKDNNLQCGAVLTELSLKSEK